MAEVEIISKKVHDAYREILGRDADPQGLKSATESIMNKTLTIDFLRQSLLSSNEYKQRNMHIQLSQEYEKHLYDSIKNEIYVDPANDRLL